MHTTTLHFLLLTLLAGLASGLTLSSLTSRETQLQPIKRAPKGGGGGGRGGGGGGGRGGGRGSSSVRGGSGAGRGGSGDTGFRAVGVPGVNTHGRYANFFGGGGGKPFALPASSVFAGRKMGGGTRDQVPGTRAYGSGYPGGGRGVSGQYFPFGFWPIYWHGHGRCDEYGGNATVDAQRPGGSQVMMELVAKAGAWNLTSFNTTINGTTTNVTESYWMVGDSESVTALASVLADPRTSRYGCAIDSRPILPFNSSDTTNRSIPHFENVIQWYRSSSFALATLYYNNTFAFPPLNETADFGWNASSALPPFIQTQVDAYTSYTQTPTSFLSCLNRTIAAALPIIDQAPPPFSDGEIAGIVIGSIIGACVVFCCIVPYLWRRVRKSLADRKKRRAQEERQKMWDESEKMRTQYQYARVTHHHSSSASFSSVEPPSPYIIPAPGDSPARDMPHSPRVSISMPSPAYSAASPSRHSRNLSSTSTIQTSPLMRPTTITPTALTFPEAETYLSTTTPLGVSRGGGHASRLSVASTTPSMRTACDDKSDAEHKSTISEKEEEALLLAPAKTDRPSS